METIGFVGLGTIGGVIARNIRKAGYSMPVHDILPEATRPLVEEERVCRSPAEVARRSRVIFTSLRVRGSGGGGAWRRGSSREFTTAVSMWICRAAARASSDGSRPSSGSAARMSWMRRSLSAKIELPTEALRCWRRDLPKSTTR